MIKQLFVFTLWAICAVVLHTQGLGNVQLLQMTDVATLGSNFSFICTYGVNVTYVKWIGGPTGTTFIELNTSTCAVQQSHDISNLLFYTGYRYQTLTFVNVTREMNGNMWICLNEFGFSSSRITVDGQHNVTLWSLSPTTWYGSNFTFICSYEPGFGTSRWFLDGQLQFSLSEESCSPVVWGYTFQCTKYQHVLTLTGVTSDDNGDKWQCSAASDVSNKVELIAFPDPGFPSNVSLMKKPDTDQGSNWQALICGTTCEEEFSFNWDVDIRGDFLPVYYDSCNSICSQTLTLYVDESDNGKLVQCTVTNTRTGKTDSVQYQIVSRDQGITTSYNNASSTGISTTVTVATAVSGILVTIILIVSVILVVRFKVIRQPKPKTNVNNDKRPGHDVCLDARHEDHAEIQVDDNRLGNDGYLVARPVDYEEIQDDGNRNQYACPVQVSHNIYSGLTGYENHGDIHEYREIHVYSDTIL